MKNERKNNKKITAAAGLVFTVFDLVMFFAMRPCWSGISKTLGYSTGGSSFILNLPVYLCILFFLIAVSDLCFMLFAKKKKTWPLVYLVSGLVFFAAIIVIVVMGAMDYMRFIWRYFFEASGVTLALCALAWLLFAYPGKKISESRTFKCAVLLIAIAVSALCLTGISSNRLLFDSVVYAVEDEYQIVFSGSSDALGWVTADGKEYYDLYAGSMNGGRIHKVCIPMDVLDSAEAYEIHMQNIIYRGPFGGLLGRTVSKGYSFRPADFSDGMKYLCFSDIHMNDKAAYETESHAGDYDFLVLAGDMVSDVESFEDANYANEIASAITHGELPVIYARGNHEVKGAFSDSLYRFVGSKNEKFFYTVKMNGLYCAVLDVGEDHDDDWWEYYGTAKFDLYREQQLRFLDAEIEKGEFGEYEYRMAVCHIPVVYVNYRHDHEYIKAELTKRLNAMDIDMSVCGHQHEVMIFEPGLVEAGKSLEFNPEYADGTYSGYLTGFNFPNLMASKFGYIQKRDEENKKSQTALIVEADLDSGTQKCTYINSRGEVLDTVNPFALKSYGDAIEISADKEMK